VAKLSTPGVYETSGRVTAPWDKLYALGRYTEFWTQEVAVELSFEFEATELGYLPQAVGFVTSNAFPVTVSFYGANQTLAETMSAPAAPLRDPIPPLSGLRNAVEFYQRDRFFGAIHHGGISRVEIAILAHAVFVDDFQYGRLIPEPASVFLAWVGVLCAFLLRLHCEDR
jgi:hypothetical protein